MTNIKSFFCSAIIIIAVFSFSNVAHAQSSNSDKLIIDTTGYSVLSANEFVFGGAYANNVNKKPIVTYFEYKEGSSDFSQDTEKTIYIKHFKIVKESEDFYTSPELNLYTTYYFRAVGYFDGAENQKFYGDILSLTTGPNFIGTIPFTADYGDYYQTGTKVIANQNNLVAKTYQPPINVVVSVQATSSTTAIVTANLYNADPSEISVFMDYGETKQALSSSVGPFVFNNGKATLTLDNLNPGTTYDYEIVEDNQNLVLSDGSFTTPTAPTNSGSTTSTNNSNSGSSSSSGLVRCGIEDANGQIPNPCGFKDILTLINTVITFLIKNIAVPLAAIMFAYAGFELLTSGGSTEKKSKAIKIFTNVGLGLILVLAAFLIVKTVLSVMGYQTGNGWNWFGF